MPPLPHRNRIKRRIAPSRNHWQNAAAFVIALEAASALGSFVQAAPALLTRIETPATQTYIADSATSKPKAPQHTSHPPYISKAIALSPQHSKSIRLSASSIVSGSAREMFMAAPHVDEMHRLLIHAGSALILARPISGLRSEAKPLAPVLLAQAQPKPKPETEPKPAPPAAAPSATAPSAAAPAATAPVELIPATPTETAPAATPAAPFQAPEIKRNAAGEPLVTNSFADTDIRQALGDVALQTGVPIVADNTVQGTVTMDLNDVPLEHALQMLLQGGGYSYTQMDGYYLAGLPDPTNPNFYLLSQTEVVQLKHVTPEVILSLLAVPYGRYLSSEGKTRVVTARGSNDEDDYRSSLGTGGSGISSRSSRESGNEDIGLPAPTYKVAITAPPALIARIKADIARLDVKRPQVMLEAMVLEVSQDFFKDAGINLATRFLKFNTTGTGNNFEYSSIAGDELAQISALVQNGSARLRANPRVATGDGQTAEVEVGRENYFSIVSGSLNYAYNTLEVIRSGISLRITPRILDDSDEVLALVEPEVRDVTGRGPNGLPEITFRRAATNVRVKNGESIVIAGLLNEFDVKSENKIPVLGDLPLIGKLFRGSSTNKVKTETIIIITPRVLVDEPVPDMVQSPVLQNDLNTMRTGQAPVPFAFPPKVEKQK